MTPCLRLTSNKEVNTVSLRYSVKEMSKACNLLMDLFAPMPVYYRIIARLFTILSLLNNVSFSSAMNVTIILSLCRRCCCCFSLFLIHQLLKVFFTLSQRINLQFLKRMTLFVPFAGQVQHLLFSLSLVSIGKLTEFSPIPVYTSSSFVAISG